MRHAYRSSAWADAARRGERYVRAGPPCRACGIDTAPYYRVSAGVCWDCYFNGTLTPKREAPPRPPKRLPILPEIKPHLLGDLPEAQRRVYLGLRVGLSLRAIARRDSVSAEAVRRALQRLRDRMKGWGLTVDSPAPDFVQGANRAFGAAVLPGPDLHRTRDVAPMTIAELSTIGQIARQLNRPLHQVEYIVRTRDIEPAGRLGILRAFDSAAVERIRRELERSEHRHDHT